MADVFLNGCRERHLKTHLLPASLPRPLATHSPTRPIILLSTSALYKSYLLSYDVDDVT